MEKRTAFVHGFTRGFAGILLVALTGALMACGGGDEGVGNTDVIERFIADANAGNYVELTDYMLPTAFNYDSLDALWWENKLENYVPLALEGYDISKAIVTGAGDSRFDFYLEEYAGNLTIRKIDRYITDTTTQPVFQ